MSDKRLAVLNNHLSQIEELIPFKDKTNPAVSKSDIGWQLDHVLKVINGVCGILEKTKPSKYKKDFNLTRTVLFTIGYFPRGKAKAPKIVSSPEVVSTEALDTQLEDAKTHLQNIKPLHNHAFFMHHIFGSLSKAKTLRFLEIHTEHHLKIVRDILKQ